MGEEGKAPEGKPLSKRAYIKNFLNPRYHLRKLLEDIRAARASLKRWDFERLRQDRERLAEAFRGRLFSAYLLSGFFGAIGVFAATIMQAVTAEGVKSFLWALLLANVLATLAFQGIWGVAHPKMYRSMKGNWFVNMQRDILPVQWGGVRLVFVALLLLAPLTILIIHQLEIRMSKDVFRFIPFPIISAGVEMIVIHSTMVRLMGDLFERHSWRIADNHLSDG